MMEEIVKAFATLGGNRKNNALTGERFVEVMTTMGEIIETEELREALRLLTGHESLDKVIPQTLTPEIFTRDILGLDTQASAV